MVVLPNLNFLLPIFIKRVINDVMRVTKSRFSVQGLRTPAAWISSFAPTRKAIAGHTPWLYDEPNWQRPGGFIALAFSVFLSEL
jgi:hypothetical protein